MQKKDYELIAKILASNYADAPTELSKHRVSMIVGDFAVAFENDNPKFVASKFTRACYPVGA